MVPTLLVRSSALVLRLSLLRLLVDKRVLLNRLSRKWTQLLLDPLRPVWVIRVLKLRRVRPYVLKTRRQVDKVLLPRDKTLSIPNRNFLPPSKRPRRRERMLTSRLFNLPTRVNEVGALPTNVWSPFEVDILWCRTYLLLHLNLPLLKKGRTLQVETLKWVLTTYPEVFI